MVGYYEIADIRGINGNVITRYVGEMYIPLCVDVWFWNKGYTSYNNKMKDKDSAILH